MVFNQLCPPALIYLIFSTTQVVIDSVKGLYNTALMKIWVAILFTILLNYLCSLGLGTISWLIVFIPFILMTLVVAVLLLMFGLDPSTGKLKIQDKKNHKHHKHGPGENSTHSHGEGPHSDIGLDNKEGEKKTDTGFGGASKLNDTILPFINKVPPPAIKGKYIKIKYCTQLPTPTPTFAFFANLPQYIKEPYKRYIENKLRESFNFSGVPIHIYFRKK